MHPLLAPLLLSVLPSQLAHLLLPYLSSFLPALFPAAPRGSPVYARNYRWAFTLVVVGYVAYTLARDDGESPGEDFYAVMGVGRGAEDEVIKRAFRTLSRTYHPDRSPNSSAQFILLRRAYETLSDPTRRYAYDRFGPDVLAWPAKTLREYMHAGLQRGAGFYIASGGVMVLLDWVGRAREAAYWRYLLLALLLTLELHLLLSPTPSPHHPILTSLVPPLRQPAFRQIRLLHRIFTALSIALSQLAGIWSPAPPRREDGTREYEMLKGLVQAVEVEAVKSFRDGVVPLLAASRDPQQLELDLLAGMEQVLVDRTVSSHPEIQNLWHTAMRRSSSSATSAPPYSMSPRARRAYPTPEPEARRLSPVDQEKAARIPLPPSPPPSPQIGPPSLPVA